eukprot:12531146-Alexandrium_andersonii.AAC.1
MTEAQRLKHKEYRKRQSNKHKHAVNVLAGFDPYDDTYHNADEAFQAVTQMRATKTLEWARNRREGEPRRAAGRAEVAV